MRKILFISHYAERTGGPILLLRLIEQVKKYSNLEILILLKTGGELQEEFEKLGKTFIWNYNVKEDSSRKFYDRFTKKLGVRKRTKQENYKKQMVKEIGEVDFVFNNTITNASLLKELPLKGKKVFSYFHELAAVTRFLTTREEIDYLIRISEKIFVPTWAVKNFFTGEFNIPEEKIALLKYIIPAQKNINKEFERIRDIEPNEGKTFLAGFCGTLESRKGCDLLPLLAKKIISEKETTDIHFVWIGADKKSLEYHLLINDLQKLGLISYVTFIEPTRDAELYLSQLDILILASREEAFGLVVPEAANYEVPSIYFSNAGGIVDYLGDDAGIAIDYLDIDAMAEKVIQLKTDDQLRMSLGKRAKEKIAEYSDHKKIVEGLLQHFQNLIVKKPEFIK